MIKPRQVLGLKADGSLDVLHLSTDGEAARRLYQEFNHSDGQGYCEVALLGPYGIERHRKFSLSEIKPSKALKVKK